MKLRTQIGVVLVVLAVVLSGIVFAGFQMNKQSVTDQQTEAVAHASEEVANDLNTKVAGLKRTVRLRATNPDITAHGQPRQRRALQATVDESAFSGVSVIHRNGTMTGIAAGLDPETRDRLVGNDFSNRQYFQRAVRGETYVSTPVVAESGNHIVTISTPIYRNGTVVVEGAFSFVNGYVAVHRDEQGAPGEVISHTTVSPADGHRLGVRVPIDDQVWEQWPQGGKIGRAHA